MSDREIALAEITSLRTDFSDQPSRFTLANEAETRLLIIDRVLKALGWDEKEFRPETPASIGFIDYCLTIDDIPRIVVEAKRTGTTFRLPAPQLKQPHYAFSYIRNRGGPAFTEVFDQAEKYAKEVGVSYIVLTNGAEWVLAQVELTPGFKNVNELKAFYFGDLFDDEFRFDDFWELLYKESVTQGNLDEQFAQLNSRRADLIWLPSADLGDLKWKRNEPDQFLEEFYRLFFTEITDAKDVMLRQCYVSNSSLDQYKADLNRALEDSKPSYLPNQNTKELAPGTSPSVFVTQTGRVILVTGSVGCGKSTFVARSLLDAPKRLKDTFVLLVDLKYDVTDERDILGRLLDKIKEEWLEKAPESAHYDVLQRVFETKLNRLRHGPHAKKFTKDKDLYDEFEERELDQLFRDPEVFIFACWRFYRTKKNRGIVLFIDNVDRASESYQKQVYGYAHRIAHETGATVVITMREVTFFRGKDAGFLDVGTHDTIFHLQSPNLQQVLSRRIKYIERHMDTDSRRKVTAKVLDWNEFKVSAQKYAEKLKDVFLKERDGSDKLAILASIAWHNVREFLEILANVHSYLGTQKPDWKTTDFIALLATPTGATDLSPALPNVFRPSFEAFYCYFLKLRILIFLTYTLKSYERSAGVSANRLITFARLYGYQTKWITKSIEELVQSRLIECIEIPTEKEHTKSYKIDTDHTFRRAPLAVTLIEQIIAQPIYLALIGNSLPFYRSSPFETYKQTLLEILDDEYVDLGTIELLILDETASKAVARYLLEMYVQEKSPLQWKLHPEISSTERRLEEVIRSIERASGVELLMSSEKVIEVTRNPTLPFFENDVSEDMDRRIARVRDLPMPQNLGEARVGKSSSGALIFWALVALRTMGRQYASGAEITRMINEFLVDDHHKKEPTNISRALRKPTLQSQPWLSTIQHTSSPLYGLESEWEIYWEQVFDEPAPVIANMLSDDS